MKDTDTILLMNLIRGLYNSFRVDDDKIAIWIDFFKDADAMRVRKEYEFYIRDPERKRFPPSAPDLLPSPDSVNSEFERIMREQQEDQLMLTQYTESNPVVGMPDEIREKLERLRKRVSTND